jgi:hypothetical protein
MVDGMESRKLGSLAPKRVAKPFKTLGIFLAPYQVLSKKFDLLPSGNEGCCRFHV